MAKSHTPTLTLAASRDIPFDKLTLSQANVRRIKVGVSIEELAEDIARRGLLQGLSVRAVTDDVGQPTGMFEIPAGGRRFRALEHLVRQKRLAKNAPIPCLVREGGIAEEDSLAENIQRAPLHPIDQFRAFQSLRDKGQSEEEIAAAFFVSVAVVRQRLKLAGVSPGLLAVYAEEGLTLDQLMAFTVCDDHARQEQVFAQIQHSWAKDPGTIRRLLTEKTVRASDRRVRFVGLEAYEAAGGVVLRDLFENDDGGWLQDVALLERLVDEKLALAADAVRAEGWKWVDVGLSFPYGAFYGLRQIQGLREPLNEAEDAERATLQAEYEAIEAQWDLTEDLPQDVDARLAVIERALEAFDHRPIRFEADDMARAGAAISVEPHGRLRIERGYVRPEDEPQPEPQPAEDEAQGNIPGSDVAGDRARVVGGPAPSPVEEIGEASGEDELRPLPDRLVAELTAHRTLALQHALGADPELAFLVAVHALALSAFYRTGALTCLSVELKPPALSVYGAGLGETTSAIALEARRKEWVVALPTDAEALWDVLVGMDADSLQALFAHLVATGISAVVDPYAKRPRAIAHADRLAEALGLDMVKAGWRATGDGFLARITKARILLAVAEACGEAHAASLEGLKKDALIARATPLLAKSGWLPEPLRTRGVETVSSQSACGVDGLTEPDEAAAGCEVIHDDTIMEAVLVEALSSTPYEPGALPAIAAE